MGIEDNQRRYQAAALAQSAALPQPCEPLGRRRQVREEMDALDEHVVALIDQVDGLAERLSPLVVCASSGSGAKGAAPAPIRCELPDELHRRNTGLVVLRGRLSDLISSLEI